MNDFPKILLCWADIETTGLNKDEDMILEIAWQFTDYSGAPLTGISSYLTVPNDDLEFATRVLERYSLAHPAVKQMHLANGLWNDVLFGTTPDNPRLPISYALEELYKQLDEIREPDYEVRLAGSSIHFDKSFIETAMGEELALSHRLHDLSTLRPFLGWQGFDLDSFTKELPNGTHRAADDVVRDVQQWRSLISLLTASA